METESQPVGALSEFQPKKEELGAELPWNNNKVSGGCRALVLFLFAFYFRKESESMNTKSKLLLMGKERLACIPCKFQLGYFALRHRYFSGQSPETCDAVA